MSRPRIVLIESWVGSVHANAKEVLMRSSAYGRRPIAGLASAGLLVLVSALLAACGAAPPRSAAVSNAPVAGVGSSANGGFEDKGPASARVVPAVDKGISKILVVARADSHQAVEADARVFRIEGHGGGDYYGFSRGRRGLEGELVEATVRINRFGEEYRATEADTGEGFGTIVRDGGTVVAYAGSSRARYSSPAPGSLRVEASDGGYEEVLIVGGYGAVYERQVGGQTVEKGGLDPDGRRYIIRRADDPEGLDELEYRFSPGASGWVVGLGSSEPLAEVYIEGAEELFPSGAPDLVGLALTELAIGGAWRVFPIFMREWKRVAAP